LNVAEIVAELVNHQVPLSEIAGLDDLQIKWIFFRERDEKGELIRENIHDSAKGYVKTPVSFESMYRQVKKRQGLTPEQTEIAWEKYLEENPSLLDQITRQHKGKAAKEGRKYNPCRSNQTISSSSSSSIHESKGLIKLSRMWPKK
jgi:hypothetical protein